MRLFLLLFLVSCSSGSNLKFKKLIGAQITINPKEGANLSEVLNEYGPPENTETIKNFHFAEYINNYVLVFKDSKFIGKINNEGQDLSYNVKVSSLADSGFKTKQIAYLSPGSPDVSRNSLEFKYVQESVATALESNHITVTDDFKKANVVILVNWAISDPLVDIKSQVIPVFSYDSGTTSNISAYNSNTGYTSGTVTSSGRGLYQSGAYTKTWTETNFNRYLMLTAIDKGSISNKDYKEIWKTIISSLGPSSDLKRLVIPLSWMSMHKLNKNLDANEEYTVSEQNFHYKVFRFLVKNRIMLQQ